MKAKTRKMESFEQLETLAHDMSDIRPLTPALRREWEAARRTAATRPARARKNAGHKSQIVPISIDSRLLAQVDRHATSAGVTRSRFIADAVRLRIAP